jgi:hypothetical protein
MDATAPIKKPRLCDSAFAWQGAKREATVTQAVSLAFAQRARAAFRALRPRRSSVIVSIRSLRPILPRFAPHFAHHALNGGQMSFRGLAGLHEYAPRILRPIERFSIAIPPWTPAACHESRGGVKLCKFKINLSPRLAIFHPVTLRLPYGKLPRNHGRVQSPRQGTR